MGLAQPKLLNEVVVDDDVRSSKGWPEEADEEEG